jgi:type IV pilus assembly protein PilE
MTLRTTGHRCRCGGWTLVELLVVVVLLAVLATMAAPGYRQQLLRAHRADAQAALLALAAAQERFYLHRHRYATNSELTGTPPEGLGLAATTRDGRYRLTVGTADEWTFQASARASGAQAADQRCATFTIEATGERSATTAGGSPAPDCWR